MTKRNILVGGTLEDAARRVAAAWRKAERSETVEAEDNVTFVSWSDLASVMTDKRHSLWWLANGRDLNRGRGQAP